MVIEKDQIDENGIVNSLYLANQISKNDENCIYFVFN